MNTDSIIFTREKVAGFIDHTMLKPEATESEIEILCREAMHFGFATVCINPVFVPFAANILKDSKTKVCTVVGFPLGAVTGEIKAYEAKLAVSQGAEEIDMVMWVGALKEGKSKLVETDIARVVGAVREVESRALVKVIIETCLLTDAEKVEACKIAEAAGADYVKTSTGFSTGGANVSDIILMKKSVNPKIGIKASGGIRSADKAIELIKAGALRLGTSSGIRIMEELNS